MRVATSLLILMSFGAFVAANGAPVHVLIDFPDREDLDIAITYEEVVELTGVKHPYKVKFWVDGAFAKAGLKFTIAKADGHATITSIQEVENDSTSRWVYFVDGIRSPYHIDTQVTPQPRTISFKYEKK